MKKTVTLLLLLAMTLSLTSCNKAAEDSYSSASVEQTTEQPQEISPTKLTNKMTESELATVSKHALTLLDEPPELSSDPNAEHKVSIEFQTIDIENWRNSINENRNEMTDDEYKEAMKKIQKAEETGDQTDVQAVNDMSNLINRFEKRLYDLKTTRIISIQMAPQIRLIQNNDSELVQKIQSSLINTIPLWKNQIVIALGITNAQNALGAQQRVTEITNEMLKKNSELLKQGTIKVAEESEKAIVDVETLQKTNQDIIETLDTVLQIHEQGRQKRADAEVELQKIEGELKDKLLEIEVAANN